MNIGTSFALMLVFLAGGLISLQAPTNALLAKAGGSSVLAALISFAVGVVTLLAVWLATANRTHDPTGFSALPWYAWIGGVYGAAYVAIAAYAAPKIGLGSLITIGIAGQVVVALLLDHVGAFGLPRNPVNLVRISGILLVVAGVVLVRRG
jgi:bacterial/archaeal transporter family-2 protein